MLKKKKKCNSLDLHSIGHSGTMFGFEFNLNSIKAYNFIMRHLKNCMVIKAAQIPSLFYRRMLKASVFCLFVRQSEVENGYNEFRIQQTNITLPWNSLYPDSSIHVLETLGDSGQATD